jgi:penicillin-binding protein 1B
VAVGEAATPAGIAAELRRSGYNESRGNPIGYYLLQPNSIEVFPGPESYFDQEAGVVKFAGGRISQIVSLQDNTARSQYQLEPQLVTNVSGPNREKRRMVRFADIPTVLVQAVTSAEDKRFFQHAGFDPIRIVKAAYIDLKEGRNAQGASTLSQQLARMFWLDTGKRWTRKLAEMIITLQLEQKLSKEAIFEDYANDIYLGWRGSFRIHGFGEAAEAYLGKDLSQITLPEAAELAGMIQRPALYDPFHHPDRLRERRNVVLSLMRQNGFINEHDYALADRSAADGGQGRRPIGRGAVLRRHGERRRCWPGFRTPTSSPTPSASTPRSIMHLQRAAAEAIRIGMQSVDDQIQEAEAFPGTDPSRGAGGAGGHRSAHRRSEGPGRRPQLRFEPAQPRAGQAPARLDLQTVRLRRRPGYREWMARRASSPPAPPWSTTSPPSSGSTASLTRRHNFKNEYYGTVTLREALAHSLNNATVSWRKWWATGRWSRWRTAPA